jgi:hypothetical protein
MAPRAPSHSVAEVTQVHAPAPVEVLPSDAPDSGWSAPPPPMPEPPPTAPAMPAPAASAPAADQGPALRKIAREAVEEALGSLRTSQRELDARLKTIEQRLEQLAHRPPPLPVASPAPAPVAPAPAPMVPAFAPAAPAPVAAPAAAPVSMIPVSIAPAAMPSTAPATMDATTAELMRLANAGVSDDMLGGEFDGSRRSRRLKWVFGFLIFLVIGGAVASILISQSMNSHG